MWRRGKEIMNVQWRWRKSLGKNYEKGEEKGNEEWARRDAVDGGPVKSWSDSRFLLSSSLSLVSFIHLRLLSMKTRRDGDRQNEFLKCKDACMVKQESGFFAGSPFEIVGRENEMRRKKTGCSLSLLNYLLKCNYLNHCHYTTSRGSEWVVLEWN